MVEPSPSQYMNNHVKDTGSGEPLDKNKKQNKKTSLCSSLWEKMLSYVKIIISYKKLYIYLY
jgi:hypothetical protein